MSLREEPVLCSMNIYDAKVRSFAFHSLNEDTTLT